MPLISVLGEAEACLVYRAGSRISKVVQRDLVSKNKTKP